MEVPSDFTKLNIDESQLARALGKLKLTLGQFELGSAGINSDLAALFHQIIAMDFSRAKRSEKDALIVQLRKFTTHSSSSKGEKVKVSGKQKVLPVSKIKDIDQPIIDLLGIVKFVADDQSHGYVVPFKRFSQVEQRDFWNGIGYAISAKDIAMGTQKGHLLIFEKQVIRDREVAANIGAKFPVFIVNHENSNTSKAYILIPSYWKSAIDLNQKLESGFSVLSLGKKRDSQGWEVKQSHSIPVIDQDILSFGLAILGDLLQNHGKHRLEIQIIEEVLLRLGAENYLIEAYRSYFVELKGKAINEIHLSLKDMVIPDFLGDLVGELTQSLSGLGCVLWAMDKGGLPEGPYSEEELLTWQNEVFELQQWLTLQGTLLKLLDGNPNLELFDFTIQFTIARGWDIETEEDVADMRDFLAFVQSKGPEIVVDEFSFRSSNPGIFIALLKEGVIQALSREKVLEWLKSLQSKQEQAAYIESLEEPKIHSYYSSLPELNVEYAAFLVKRISKVFSGISSVAMDIESNEHEVKEIAWVRDGQDRLSHLNYGDMQTAISAMADEMQGSSLVIGQNVKRFDLPILQSLYAVPLPVAVWDTLEIEMVLNPMRLSFGLMTTHSASDDAWMADRLFRNQLARLCLQPALRAKIASLLPETIQTNLENISQESIWQYLNLADLNAQSDEFFRIERSKLPISEEVFLELEEQILHGTNTVVVAPRLLWNSLARRLKIYFYDERGQFNHVLSATAIAQNLDGLALEKCILSQFLEGCESTGLLPLFETMPMAIRLLVGEEKRMLCTDDSNVPFLAYQEGVVCLAAENLDALDTYLRHQPQTKVILLGEEISRLTSKLQLGETFDSTYFFDKMKDEPGIWIQMSGGKKVIPIDSRFCGLLGIKTVPVNTEKIWIEKVARGRFEVWCNISIDACLSQMSGAEIVKISLLGLHEPPTNISVVKGKNRQGFSGLDMRLNPGSLFRHLYWTYQFMAMDGLHGNPKVLLVNDSSEIGSLQIFAQQQGYFVPDAHASLARQLELLHGSRFSKKCIVIPIQEIENLIGLNYLDSLDYVWDSFLLEDAKMMLQARERSAEEEDPSAILDYDENGIVSIASTTEFELFQTQKPVIDFLGKFIASNHAKSRLLLLDPRLSSYPGVQNVLGAGVLSVALWGKASEYQSIVDEAAKIFGIAKAHQEIDFDISEAKEILRQIFLRSENENKVHEWRDFQHPYLDAILPANENLLISLPTGAGKSILFQGPALFRAALSDKLTIVVSPLKALITDQVENLQSRGFYSNVDCLSGDRGQLETRDTLRRVAGGEITLLYVTPERFRSRAFENAMQTRMQADNGLEFVVFDEAHCISQWGQEFRPDYLNVARRVAEYGIIPIYSFKVLLFSATISEQVFLEISSIIPAIQMVAGAEKSYNPVRDHIGIDFERVNADDRLENVANYLGNGKFNPAVSRAIVFMRSRANTEDFALAMPDVLKRVIGNECKYADQVGTFHAGMDAEDRRETYEKYKKGDISLLFATKAFGMGMDIPNIHYLCHYKPPSTFEDFLQEIGRAGRNEKERIDAGFSDTNKLIRTKCFTGPSDFKEQKDLLHRSRISWLEVKEIKQCLETYIEQFSPLRPDPEHAIAIPFNLYSLDRKSVESDTDTKFRIGLHWLEKLGRIKLGFFTITHLEFETGSLKALHQKLDGITDQEVVAVCKALLEIVNPAGLEGELIQVNVAALRQRSGLSSILLLDALLRAHVVGLVNLRQSVVLEGTKIRTPESEFAIRNPHTEPKYPALRTIFAFARSILESIPSFTQKVFDGEELDRMLREAMQLEIPNEVLPWLVGTKDQIEKANKKYQIDLVKKRSRHGFTILRMLDKVKYESKMDTVLNGLRMAEVRQAVYNGYGKREDWHFALMGLEAKCVMVLDKITRSKVDENIKVFNWPDLAKELILQPELKKISNVLFTLSVLGYVRSSGLMPSGIELYLHALDPIKEEEIQSEDQRVYNEFEETKRVRELKLVALETLSKLPGGNFDSFIRKYFACASSGDLIRLLESELDPSDPVLSGFRQEAIKFEEKRLNPRQREAYDADVAMHVNVMAGPGTGKTHTLTLRVARLVHHLGVSPDEILVLAYNRAVVSELKERLTKLFGKLGYDSLVKRLKILTFHGLAKKYCTQEVEGKDFATWELTLRNLLTTSPGRVMGQIGALRHILIDEFQDINETRIEILDEILKHSDAKLFIIGDPNQSIYGYERKKVGHPMSPWPYYEKFNSKFEPIEIALVDNHRSYPKILELASEVLEQREEHADLIPVATKTPSEGFLENYVEEYDTTIPGAPFWWDKVVSLLEERVDGKPYSQIAVLFRSNNEVYLGFQRLKVLVPPTVRVRIQGSLAYDLTRIRECHAVLMEISRTKVKEIGEEFAAIAKSIVSRLLEKFPNWNQYYLRLMQAVILEFIEDQDDAQPLEMLLEFIQEITRRDDGQLFKIYEKHKSDLVKVEGNETEIVLTTMHKVKGLEFDAVVVPASFMNLPLNQNPKMTVEELFEEIGEERRLTFVSYTRARYRLVIYQHRREKSLLVNQKYALDEAIATEHIGRPVASGIEKVWIGWAARNGVFQNAILKHVVESKMRSGDPVVLKKIVNGNSSSLVIYSGLEKGLVLGALAQTQAHLFGASDTLDGLVVNEVVVWTYEETVESDFKNGTNFAKDWCADAKAQGYIYLVDFAGYGKAP